jgi:hypothetical protein
VAAAEEQGHLKKERERELEREREQQLNSPVLIEMSMVKIRDATMLLMTELMMKRQSKTQ